MTFFKRMFKKAPVNEPPAQVKAMFERIRQFLADEAAQNDMYPSDSTRAILAGVAVDQVPGGTGEFGRDSKNPIPVNGFIGELVYISQLRTSTGTQMLGHRLGSIDQVDAFELVSIDGAVWDLLYFDLYHPRKSRRLPNGYARQDSSFVFATNERVPNFPLGLREAVSLCTKGFLGVPLVAPELFDDARFGRFDRSVRHAEAVESLRLTRQKPAS